MYNKLHTFSVYNELVQVRSADVAYHGKYSQKKLQEEVEEEIYPPSIHCTVTYRSPPGSSGHIRQNGLNIEGTEKGRILIPIEVFEIEGVRVCVCV